MPTRPAIADSYWNACVQGVALATVLYAAQAVGQSTEPASQPDAAKPSAVSAPVQIVAEDPSGARVQHAQVRVSQFRANIGSPLRVLQTNRNGEATLVLAPGTYSVAVTAPGFLEEQQSLEVSSGARQTLAVKMRIAAREEEVNVSGSGADGSDSSDEEATVIRGAQLQAFSNSPGTLQQQINALVQTDDGSPPEIRVDGFSNGSLPPKSAIREIRVNQNAFSAQFDQRGNSVVDVFTRPGGQKLQGSLYLSGNADPLNARNPYQSAKPEYRSIFFDGNVSGPLGKHTSFFAGTTTNDLEDHAAVNAEVLDASLNIVPFSQSIADPLLTRSANLRIDRQISERNTLTARGEWSGTHQDNAGIGTGQLVLPSQAYTSGLETFALQVGDTAVVSPRLVTETRFQYRRTRTSEVPNSTAASITVQGGFNGGGSPGQQLRDALDNYEWQEYVSYERGRHFFRGGARYRWTRDSNTSTQNYNGQYTFKSLQAYQTTLRGIAAGQTPAQIRAAGGGASQSSVTVGRPSAVISTGDLGAYLEDEWKVAPSFSLTGGLRYESQYGIPDHNDPAPRLGFAWALTRRGSTTPFLRLRGGIGMFYSRFAAENILIAARENGVRQQVYFQENPDTFPATPQQIQNAPAGMPGAANQPSTLYQIAPNLHSTYVLSEGLTADRKIWRGDLTVAFTHERGVHQTLSRNANAPLNGVRPLGGTQNVYQFDSLGWSNTTTLAPNYHLQLGSRVFVWANYTLRFRDMAGFGADAFLSNSYNVAADYGRTPSVARHRLFLGSSFNLPSGWSGTAFLAAHSTERFNITTGQDNNGDSLFNDRPAFATDLDRPSVVRTSLGNFDTSPTAGQAIVPVDYGIAPAFYSLQTQFGREFLFGHKLAAEPAKPGAKPEPVDRYFHCFLGVDAQNVLNHRNPSAPIGQLSSPFFGRSLSLDVEQTGVTAANRVVNLVVWLRF